MKKMKIDGVIFFEKSANYVKFIFGNFHDLIVARNRIRKFNPRHSIREFSDRPILEIFLSSE